MEIRKLEKQKAAEARKVAQAERKLQQEAATNTKKALQEALAVLVENLRAVWLEMEAAWQEKRSKTRSEDRRASKKSSKLTVKTLTVFIEGSAVGELGMSNTSIIEAEGSRRSRGGRNMQTEAEDEGVCRSDEEDLVQRMRDMGLEHFTQTIMNKKFRKSIKNKSIKSRFKRTKWQVHLLFGGVSAAIIWLVKDYIRGSTLL